MTRIHDILGGMARWLMVAVLSVPAFSQVQAVHTRWNGHNAEFVFLASNPRTVDALQVRIDRGISYKFRNAEGWAPDASTDSMPPLRLRRQNIARTNLLLQLPITAQESLVFISGSPVGSSPGGLLVLRLVDAKPVEILRRAELELLDVADLDGDGVAEIIGQPCYSQTIGGDIFTYDPRHVFRLVGRKAVLSEKLSRTYNRKHYAGWIGPDCSEEYFVLPKQLARGGRRIVPRAEAERLAAGRKN